MPIVGQGWEFLVQRVDEQKRGAMVRTVGTYQVFHDGDAVSTVAVGDVEVPLSGTTAESPGPGQNSTPATSARPSRILAGRYPLKTSGGPMYVTSGYRQDLRIEAKMPGIELRKTGNRSSIIIHPGKNEFLSSIGCINLCTSLPDSDEDIDYPGSRLRVIALIEDLRRYLRTVPDEGDVAILNAHVVVDGEPGSPRSPRVAMPGAGSTIDGRAVAARHGVGVKSNAVNIARLHPKMAPVIEAVARSADQLGLPQPVITSGNDGGHKQASLHFRDRALDFRGNNITLAQGRSLAEKVMRTIGGDYDVLFEIFADRARNHLHVEFDPD